MRSRSSSENSVIVEVCASRFNIMPSLFKKVEGLAWFEHRGVRHLNSSPDVFENLLQYFLFGSLPDVSALPDHEVVELCNLATSLKNTESLLRHVETASKRPSRVSPGSSSSSSSASLPLSSDDADQIASVASKSKKFSFRNPHKKLSRRSLLLGSSIKPEHASRTTSDRTIYPFALSPTIPQVLDEEATPGLIQAISSESDITPSFDADDMTISTRGSRSSRRSKHKSHHHYAQVDNNSNLSAMLEPSSKAKISHFKGIFTAKKVSHLDWCTGFDFVV